MNSVNGKASMAVVANVAHSYAIIKVACREVAAMPKWLGNPKGQKLKFSNRHIHGLLKRANMGRKRLCTIVKPNPTPVADVRAAVADVRATFIYSP